MVDLEAVHPLKCRLQDLNWGTVIELWIILFRAYKARLAQSPWSPPLLSPSTCTAHRGECPAVCVPCVVLPAVRQGMDPGRLTAGSSAVPRDQQSFAVSHSYRGSKRGQRQAILDGKFQHSFVRANNSALKVNKHPKRNTDKIRVADPLFVC